jgi:phosphatidylethanolamine/phosphatidyl-N-methylethanolamine N-methyltransferase
MASHAATSEGMVAPGKNENNAAKYRRLSPVYDWAARNRLFERPRARMFELAAIQPTDRVLVVGVGTGLDLSHMPDGADVTGIDPSPAMLARAEGRARKGKLTLRLMNAEQLAFAAASFDVVVMSCILTVVEDPQQTLAEAARVLRPGGALWIMSKFCESTPGLLRRAFNWFTTSVGGASLTVSLIDAIGSTPLRVTHHETAVAVDIFRLEHA